MTSRRSVLRFLGYGSAALGAAALLTSGCARFRTDRAEDDYPPIGEFVDVDGTQVHYLTKGTGPDLVLIHGAGGNLREFTFDLMDRLTDRYRVTAFDRPGLGYTGRAPGIDTRPTATVAETPLQQAQLLRSASAALGLEAPIVVGHSFGGIVGYAWAVLDMDDPSPAAASAVVSLAGVAMPWPGGLGAYYTVNASAFGGAVTVPFLSAFVPESVVADRITATFTPQPVPEGYTEHIGARLTLRPDTFRANTRQVAYLRPHVVELSKRYPELTLPIEILHGTDDTTVPIDIHSERLVKIIPSANLTVMQGVGHMPHHADPQMTIAAIDRAFARR